MCIRDRSEGAWKRSCDKKKNLNLKLRWKRRNLSADQWKCTLVTGYITKKVLLWSLLKVYVCRFKCTRAYVCVWSPEGVGDREFHGNWAPRLCPILACRNGRHHHMLIAESANRISSPFQEFFSPFLITMKTNVTLKGPQQKRGSSFAFCILCLNDKIA